MRNYNNYIGSINGNLEVISVGDKIKGVQYLICKCRKCNCFVTTSVINFRKPAREPDKCKHRNKGGINIDT